MHSSKNGQTKSRRTIFIGIGVVLSFIVGTAVIAWGLKPSTLAGTPIQANMIEQELAFIKSAGFSDPNYRGETSGVEGAYPTFRAKALNGESIDMWLHADPDVPWTLQPVGYFRTTIKSADELVRIAQRAVDEWEHMPPNIRPSTNGSWGEYESRQYDYDLIGKYAASRN